MIRINKNLVIFSGLISLLGTSVLVFLQKLSPLISHTTYYCQSFINSLSFSIPYYLGFIPFLLFFAFLFVAIIKLLTIYIKVRLLRKKLLRNCKYNTSFTMLLKKLQLTKKAYLIKNKKQFAFCLGVRKPKIYISTALLSILDEREIEAVLRHERYHLENRDTLTMIVVSIGESLLPFFPLLSDLLHSYRVEREIKADQEAILGLGDEKPLIAVLKKLLGTPSVAMVSVAAIADHDTLEPRILRLVQKEFHFKRFKVKHILISIFSAFVMGVIVFSPVQAFEVHHQGQDVMMICPRGSSCINACKQEYPTEKANHSENLLYSPMK